MNEPINSQNPPSVLMVDDTPANLELLSGMLKGKGYKVRAAVSGQLALRAIRNDPPDLVLLDITMPEMNGYEVCEKLKADEKLKDIPIIFLSALSETIDKVKAFGAGGVDYITKPFQFEEVEARVETHLELRRQKRQLQENYDNLRELEKLRDSLVHMIIHDLRSPLTSVYGFLGLIEENAESTPLVYPARLVGEAMKAAKQMIQIVNDVLDVSKMEGGEMKLKLAECDLSQMLEECVSGLKALFEGGEIRFSPPAAPAMVVGDHDILFRVVQNLLANAIKFTPRKGGLIRLDIKSSGDSVRVSFRDSGPGVAPEHRQKIFEKFGQVELRDERHRNSTGLGLAFSKLAVEAHGGRIGVDSEEGKGSSFWFELPVGGPVPHAKTAPAPVGHKG
jgi:two-component system sensor histidine kinase/response regulator